MTPFFTLLTSNSSFKKKLSFLTEYGILDRFDPKPTIT